MSQNTPSQSESSAVVDQKQRNQILKEEQRKFVTAVSQLRDKKKKEKHILQSTSHFEYGKDPQKDNSTLGKRKVLPRLCSKDIYGDLKAYIDDDIKFEFCVKKCCYNLAQYDFAMQHSINLSQRFAEMESKCICQMGHSKFMEEALITYLISNKTKDCVLQVNDLKFYIKTISQDALSSAMEPRQNANRISYGPLLLVPITDNILMRIQCEIAGIGYSDLPNHKVNRESGEACSVGGCIHRMIHIHKDFVKDVYISFGFKQPGIATRIDVTLLSDKKCVTLLTIHNKPRPQQTPNTNNGYALCHKQTYHSSDYRHSPMKFIK
eukprot:498240_1